MKVSPLASTLIILAVVCLAVGIGFHQIRQILPEAGEVSISSGHPFQTEEEWTVMEISRFLADFGGVSLKLEEPASLELKKIPSAGKAGEFEVKWRKLKQMISVARGVWNPASYETWAKQVMGTPDPAVPDATNWQLAQSLLTPGFSVFYTENQRISQFLNQHPTSAAGHLQAALLLGTVALNDFAGEFSDIRIPLNRMVAHMAAAMAMGISLDDPAWRLAESLRLTLCGQQSDALKSLASWKDTGFMPEWNSILHLRNTSDWRGLRQSSAAAGPALKTEYFRALSHAIDPAAGIEFLKETGEPPQIANWRAANECNLSVSLGHMISANALNMEMTEAAAAAKAYGIPVSENDLTWLKAYLDTPEGSPIVLGESGLKFDIAGQNLMAGFHQRHFMQATSKLYEFLNDRWGVPESSKKLLAFINTQLPEMRYKPFLQRIVARNQPERIKTNAVCEQIIAKSPQMVTPSLWTCLRLDQNNKKVLSSPDFHAWFNPEVPEGTAFETSARLVQIGVGDENNDPWLKELWERSPYSYPLSMHNAYLENGRTYENLGGPVVSKWLEPILDYNLSAIRRLAACYKTQPDLYETQMVKAASLDPDCYIEMGDYFANLDSREKAAKYYLAGFHHAIDRVYMANSSLWLVKYLCAQGELETASAVAEDAAEVYSYDGLVTKMWFMEAQGKWEEALDVARKIDARYNGESPISEVACLIRAQSKAAGMMMRPGVAEKIQRFFPKSVQKVSLSDFSLPPTSGVLIQESGPKLVPFGLNKGMVIVAIDGHRVDNFNQYRCLRELSSDPEMSLIVWDGQAYRVSDGKLPNKRFNVDMGDYSP